MGGESHAPAALLPRMTRYPFYRRLGVPEGQSGRLRNNSPPKGFDPRTVQPVASRYTNRVIPDPSCKRRRSVCCQSLTLHSAGSIQMWRSTELYQKYDDSSNPQVLTCPPHCHMGWPLTEPTSSWWQSGDRSPEPMYGWYSDWIKFTYRTADLDIRYIPLGYN
jgi:hypothetical protein